MMTTMTTMTLAEFLLARITEDEAEAKEHQHYEGEIWETAGWWNCTRVLAECDAKRRLVEWARERSVLHPGATTTDGGPATKVTWPGHPKALELLALPYADHPDYLLDWRP